MDEYCTWRGEARVHDVCIIIFILWRVVQELQLQSPPLHHPCDRSGQAGGAWIVCSRKNSILWISKEPLQVISKEYLLDTMRRNEREGNASVDVDTSYWMMISLHSGWWWLCLNGAKCCFLEVGDRKEYRSLCRSSYFWLSFVVLGDDHFQTPPSPSPTKIFCTTCVPRSCKMQMACGEINVATVYIQAFDMILSRRS